MSLSIAPETIKLFTHAELGEVEETITLNQRGRVRCMATYWFAQFYQPNGQRDALPGTTVRVIGRQGLTLLVVTVNDDVIQPQMPMPGHLAANQAGMLRLVQQMGSVFANLLSEMRK